MFLKVSALILSVSATSGLSRKFCKRRDDVSSWKSECAEERSCVGDDNSVSEVCAWFEDDCRYSRAPTAVTTGCIIFPSCRDKDGNNYCKALSNISCMVKLRGDKNSACPNVYNKTPYYEFCKFLSFNDYIPVDDASEAFKGRSKRFDTELYDYIKTVRDYSSFDSMVPYLYNVDLYQSILQKNFDVQYMTWFINSFVYYLKVVHPDQTVQLVKDKLCHKDTREEIDLVCIPEKYKCTYAHPACIFNKILGSAVNRPLLLDFISIIIVQIQSSSTCASKSCGACSQDVYTTYASYKDVLVAALSATAEIVQDFYNRKSDFVQGTFRCLLAAVPYKSTTSTASSPTNMTSFMVVPESSVNTSKLIDYM